MNSNENTKDLYRHLTKGQSPFCLVVCCSDSRVSPEMIFHTKPGELFVIRTAGNTINEGELASVEYGIHHLSINYVLVMGHTHCGAIHASINQHKGKYMSPILDNIHKNINGCHDEVEAAKLNAQAQVNFIKAHFPEYKGEVVSALYNIETNKVEIFD